MSRPSAGGSGVVCSNCKQPGHHVRDCPNVSAVSTSSSSSSSSSSYGGMRSDSYPSRKRGRDDDMDPYEQANQALSSAYDDVEVRLRALLVRIGEKSQASLETNIEVLSSALKEDVSTHGHYLSRVLLSCMRTLPAKSSIYACLLGLINLYNYTWVQSVVQRVHSDFAAALSHGRHFETRLLLRLVACLSHVGIISTTQFLTLVDSYMAPLTTTTLTQPQKDTILHTIITLLPWIGPELTSSHTDRLQTIMDRVATAMQQRSPPSSLLSIFPDVGDDEKSLQLDLLSVWWSAVQALSKKEWRTDAIVRPHVAFMKEFASGGKSHEFDLPIPSMADQAGITLRPYVTLFADLDENEKTRTDPSSISQLILSDNIHDLITIFHTIHKEGTKHLVSLPVQREEEYVNVMIQTLFSTMMTLSFPNQVPAKKSLDVDFPILFVGTVLIDLFKAQPKKMPPILASATHLLFEHIPLMDLEIRDRFVEWFAFHLSNFSFMWPWTNWNEVLEYDETHPKRQFIREVLSRCVRLAYWERVQPTIPAEFMVLMPDQPSPAFRFSKENNDENDEDAQVWVSLASHLISMITNRSPSSSLTAWLDTEVVNKLGAEARGALLFPCLLESGNKSYSHIFALLERYKPLLDNLLQNEGYRHLFLHSIHEYWQHSQQHVQVIIDRVLLMQYVDATDVVTWIMQQGNLQQWWLFHILFASIDKTLDMSIARAKHARQQDILAASGDLDQQLDAIEQHNIAMLLTTVSSFVTAIQTAQSQSEMEVDENDTSALQAKQNAETDIRWLQARFKQFVRKYLPLLARDYTTIHQSVFSADAEIVADPTLRATFEMIPELAQHLTVSRNVAMTD